MDWHQFEPDAPMSPSSYFDSFIVDDLENLTGLYNPYPFNRGGEDVVDDLKVIEEDPGMTIEGVSNTIEAEEVELPIMPIEIPNASFGSTRLSSRKSRSRE